MHAFFIRSASSRTTLSSAARYRLRSARLYTSARTRRRGIVVANFGDGACGRGPVLESLNMSAMDQIRQLWGTTDNGNNPGLRYCSIYSTTSTAWADRRWARRWSVMPARIGAGVNPDEMHSERVNGYNPFAVIDAVSRKKELLLAERDRQCSTLSPTERPDTRRPTRRPTEPLRRSRSGRKPARSRHTRKSLILGGVATSEEFDAIDEVIINRMTKVCRLAVDEEISPRMDLDKNPDAISGIMFSNEKRPVMEEGREPEC